MTKPTFIITDEHVKRLARPFALLSGEQWVTVLSTLLALASTAYFFQQGVLVSYGDAESHLNIAKRVIHSMTPGFAQLGGIWLPLPHMFLIPFVSVDFLWRTGLAGAIVSGVAFVISSVFLYKLGYLLMRSATSAFVVASVFMLNPNVLYLQSTPMTEVVLIAFFVLSSYFFIRFLLDDSNILMLIAAALFGFCASLSRYDGWGLVAMEAGVLFLHYLPFRLNMARLRGAGPESGGWITVKEESTFVRHWQRLEGRLILFSSLAFFGIFLWMVWGYLILGDPLYFTHSQFSANSQQQSWNARGELPAYHNVGIAFVYYLFTSMESSGILLASIAFIGMGLFAFNTWRTHWRMNMFVMLIVLVPFFFNVLTLFLGQSVIFLPGITPITFEWTLFNVRYGTMMVPAFALFIGYAFYRSALFGRLLIVGLVGLQCLLFAIGFTPVLALQDGVVGLSSATAKIPDAQQWLAREYDHGILLTDDFARTVSIVRVPRIHMQDVIYIGNKPFWEESLVEPEKYARWIIMQKDDTVWKNLNDDPEKNARLYKYFNKVYTSDTILIFKRIEDGSVVR